MAARTLIGTKWSFGNNGGSTSIVLPARGTIEAGSLVVVSFRWESSDTFTGVSDSAGGAWSFEKQFNSNVGAVVAWCWNHPGGTGVVITGAFSGNVSYRYAEAAEFSGGDTEDPRTGAAVKSNATLNHSVTFTPPGLIFSTQSNYSGSSYTVTTGTELGKGSYHCTSYILNQTTSPGAPQHTGGSGSTASISVAFAEPVLAPTAPIIEGPLAISDRTYNGYTVSGWSDTETGTAVDDWQISLNGGTDWISLGASATEYVATGRTHGAYDDVRLRALDASDEASNVLLLDNVHVGFEVYAATAMEFPESGLGNTEIRMLMDPPPSRTSCTLIWHQQVFEQETYYGGMLFAPITPGEFDGGRFTAMFVQHGADGTFDSTGQRLVGAASPIYEEIAGLRTSTVSYDYIASHESIVGAGNQEAYLVDFDVWVKKAATIELIGGTTVRHTFYVDLSDTSKTIIQEIPLSVIDLQGDDPGLYYGTPPWITGFNADEAAYGRVRGIKVFSAPLDISDIVTEANTESNTPVTTDGLANVYYTNINPVHTDITDKSGEGNDFAWTTANRPTNWSGEVEVEIEEAAIDLTIQETSHGHTADNLTLTTTTTLSIADCTHAHTADALTLSTGTSLSVAEASHAHTADALTLSTGTSLTVAEASHAHTADSLGLTTDSTLAVADAIHGHTADNLTLVPTTGDTLVVQDATHAHSADALVLTTDQLLAIADAVHAHTADSPALSTQILLTVADAEHAHSADNITLSDVPALAIADALHAHAADSIALTSQSWLAVQDALHAHRADSVLLDTGDGQYDVDDGRLLPIDAGRAAALSGGYSLNISGGRTANFVR